LSFRFFVNSLLILLLRVSVIELYNAPPYTKAQNNIIDDIYHQ
jgi:hypothetical protein